MCHLAIARCEQSIGNTSGEVEALISAARCYLKAEKNIHNLECLSFEENLVSSIHGFNHAIRLLEEKEDLARASGLCLELGDALLKLDKSEEALTFYKRAAGFRPKNSLSHLVALEKVGTTQILVGDQFSGLVTFTEMAGLAETQCKPRAVTSVYLDILARCEVYRVLLLLLIQPRPQTMSPRYLKLHFFRPKLMENGLDFV